MERSGVVSLLTDFGTADTYAGIMKGVILRLDPQARLVDLTHEIPPQAVSLAALLLGDALPFFPPGTVHLVVVDPGVGTGRRALAVEGERALGVGPDNGVLTPILREAREVVEATESSFFLSPISDTFHGRDVFAPLAAALARGTELRELGEPVRDARCVEAPKAELVAGDIVGEVLWVDRFGNLITNIGGRDLVGRGGLVVELAGQVLRGMARNYQEGKEDLRTLMGSAGRLEISLRGGHAADHLGVGPGARVVVRSGD